MVGSLTCNERKIRSFISGEQSQILRGRGKQRQNFGTGNIFSFFWGKGNKSIYFRVQENGEPHSLHALGRPHRSIIYEYGSGRAPVCYLKSIYAVVYCIPDSNLAICEGEQQQRQIIVNNHDNRMLFYN